MDLYIFNADQHLESTLRGMGFTTRWDTPNNPTTLVAKRVDLASDVIHNNLIRATEGYQTDSVRSVGFGEDGPRFSHENGYFTDNYPWLD